MREIKNNIFFCGVKDADRKLFDELIALPDGTSYNSYFIQGSEKTALVDTTYSTKIDEFLDCLKVEKIDYIIANHGEGDHTDGLCAILERFPNAKVLASQKCMEILIDAHEIAPEKFQTVSDGEEISLGDKTLQFILAPWVHWPDTIFTYVKEDKTLFTCDFLGSHYVVDDIWAPETEEYLAGAKRYYAEIMMPFCAHVKKYLDKIDALAPEMICPSHGGVYNEPNFILRAYRDWTADVPCNKAVLGYVSMYKNTENAINLLEERLLAKGVMVDKFNLAHDDVGEYICALTDAATVVFGAPMVLAGPHPVMLNIANLTNALRPNIKFVGIVGSFGWGGNLADKLQSCITLNVEKLAPVLFRGKAKAQTIAEIDALADLIAQKHEGRTK
jgi:flavorubredoxin